MSHTRGRTNNGRFYFECFDFTGALFERVVNIDTAAEADKLAHMSERRMMQAMSFPMPTVDDAINAMSDDDLLAALSA